MKTITSDDPALMELYTTLLKDIGEQIRTIRKSQGESQFDLASCIESERAVISNIENGHANVMVKTLVRIAFSLEADLVITITLRP